MDSLKQKYKDVREEGIRNKVSSVRGDGLRKKVPNVFNRDKDSSSEGSGETYSPRPISELKDPSFYPPPPRRRTTEPHGVPTLPRPLPARTATSTSREATSPSRGPPPSLPPRLPPRQASAPPHDPYINQAAASRLAASGISVPDLGISPSKSPSPRPAAGHQPPPQKQPGGSGGGSTWAQKKSALQTIGDLRRDPSSVSVSDARAAAGTANNFRERHGEQVAKGARTAGALGQRFGVAERLGANGGSGGGGAAATASSLAAGIAGKRKPPPPPPKKAALAGESLAADEPPPLPMSTKPRF